METRISIFWIIWLIAICNNQIYSQEERYHQVLFGNQNKDEQFEDYSFGQEIAPTSTYQKYKNILEIQANFTMAYIWIYNELGFEIFSNIDTNYIAYTLPDGYYNIFTGYAPEINHHTFIIEENIDVTDNRHLKLFFQDAIFSNVYNFKKINAETLNISSIFLYFFNLLNVPNLSIRHVNINSNQFVLKHNTLPDHFYGEWAVKGKPGYNNDDLYLLNNQLFFIESDTLITNDINSYAFADIDFVLPDSILPSTQKQIFTFIPDFHNHGSGDLYYTYPLTQRIYQDTSAAASFLSSKFWQSLFLNNISIPYTYITTSEIQIHSNKIIGRHFRDSDSPSFIMSDTSFVKLGQMPTFWFGKFNNSVDTIKIRSSYGEWEYLFLSQTNDLLRHFPILYEIFQDSILVRFGEFNLLFGSPGLRLGFDPGDLTIPVSPGQYIMNIVNPFNEITGAQGYSNVKASFNLNNSDKNPPNLISFQLLSGNKVVNIFFNNSNNKVRFIIEDNVMVDSISLKYSSIYDSNKYEIPLGFNAPYFEGFLPELPPGYFNLHTFIQDNSNNYIECVMSPAFYMDSSVLHIEEPKFIIKEFELFQNYPNPFNSTTKIPFFIPPYERKVKIHVYNIRGQHVKSFYINNSYKAYNTITWDGFDKNNKSVPSGIYIIQMKGGSRLFSKKIILLK